MQFLVDCFITIWHCTGGGTGDPGPQHAPEINAANSFAAIALLLSIGAIVYRRLQQEQQS